MLMKLFIVISSKFTQVSLITMNSFINITPLGSKSSRAQSALGHVTVMGNILVWMEIVAERYKEVVVTVVFVEWCFYLWKFHMALMQTWVHID